MNFIVDPEGLASLFAPMRPRCTLCGGFKFTYRSMVVAPPGGGRGVLCEPCVEYAADKPGLVEPIMLAVLAGACVADCAKVR